MSWFRTLALWRGFGKPRCARPGTTAQPFMAHGVWPWSRQRAGRNSGTATPHATGARFSTAACGLIFSMQASRQAHGSLIDMLFKM